MSYRASLGRVKHLALAMVWVLDRAGVTPYRRFDLEPQGALGNAGNRDRWGLSCSISLGD
jgi:hypothetical protein